MEREESIQREMRRARLLKEARQETVRAAGAPKAQSQFFGRRFSNLVARLKSQGI